MFDIKDCGRLRWFPSAAPFKKNKAKIKTKPIEATKRRVTGLEESGRPRGSCQWQLSRGRSATMADLGRGPACGGVCRDGKLRERQARGLRQAPPTTQSRPRPLNTFSLARNAPLSRRGGKRVSNGTRIVTRRASVGFQIDLLVYAIPSVP